MNEYNNDLYPGSEYGKIKEKTQTRNFFRRNLWAVISTGVAVVAIIALIVVLIRPTPSTNPTSPSSSKPPAALSATVGSTPVTTEGVTPVATTPTQTPIVEAGTILCQYDATHSFSDWNASPQWKQVNNGILGSDGTDTDQGPDNFLAWSGCKLSTANYAVEAQIQFVRSTRTEFGIEVYRFGIMLRGDGKMSGYELGAGEDNCGNRIAIISLVQDNQTSGSSSCSTSDLLTPLLGSGSTHNYNVDTGWHTFRAEITNNTISLFIDKQKLLETSDNTFTDAGQVGLRDIYGDINVKSFIVTAL